jgi:TRAP-type uncharacterized transport system fused permease subunit
MIEPGTLWRLTKSYWYHFGSLVSIILFMMLGFSPVLSVFYATMLAILVSFFRADTALVPPKLVKALAEGTTGILNVAPTCAAAGIIVGVVTLTGLAQRFADIIITYAAGNLLLTAIYTAAIVWIVGLAVPVTASYILCAVIAAPALMKLGVPDYAAHMFIFYYAVLSEVSPPTALSPFAAAAITGGNPYKTTLQSWKYTMPAFLVPFVFVIDPQGIGLLMKIPKAGNWFDIIAITLKERCNWFETSLFALAGMLLIMPRLFTAILAPFGFNAEMPLAGMNWLSINIILAIALSGLAILLHGKRTLSANSIKS